MEPIDLIGARFFEYLKRPYYAAPDLTDGDIVILDGVGAFMVRLVPNDAKDKCSECDCIDSTNRYCNNTHFSCRSGGYHRQLKKVGDGTS